MESTIVSNLETTNNGSKYRQSLRKGEYVVMVEKCYQWFLNLRMNFDLVNGTTLKLKAMEIQNQFCTGGYHASDGWLSRFMKRYGVRFLKESEFHLVQKI